jgi:hypothetical protein
MEQAKFRKFIPKTVEDDDDDDPQWLLRDIDAWWFRLPRDVRTKTPLPGSLCSSRHFYHHLLTKVYLPVFSASPPQM